MPDDRPASESIPLAQWLEKLGGILGPSGGPGLRDDEQEALLDIARIAAHASERIAAPMKHVPRRTGVRRAAEVGARYGTAVPG